MMSDISKSQNRITVQQYVHDNPKDDELNYNPEQKYQTKPVDVEMELDNVYVNYLMWGGKMNNFHFNDHFVKILMHTDLFEGCIGVPYSKCDKSVGYYRGCIKKDGRMSHKLQQYARDGKGFPRSGFIWDIIRASMTYEQPKQIIAAVAALKKDGKVIRIKNRFNRAQFEEHQGQNATGVDKNTKTQPLCVLVNVLFEANGIKIIGEIQLTTVEFLEVKKKQHKVYKITRAFGKKYDANRDKETYDALLVDVCGKQGHAHNKEDYEQLVPEAAGDDG